MNVKNGYEPLAAVLAQALDQAQNGKGHIRHAQDKPFDQQPMQKLIDLYGPGFALGQAAKKAQESQRLKYDHARDELLGAINYLAGAVIAMDRKHLCLGAAESMSDSTSANSHQQYRPDWAISGALTVDTKEPVWLGGFCYAYQNAPEMMFSYTRTGNRSRSSFIHERPIPANDNQPTTQAHG